MARSAAGADPDGLVWGLDKPLHVAAQEGAPEVVAELAGRVADADAEHHGRSALWNAVYHGHTDNARVLAVTETGPLHESPWEEHDLGIVGATDVPGGCVITQPGGYAPQMPGVMALLTEGTFGYGLYANPKSGNQGCIFRDGVTEGWDLHPGGDPYTTATSREVLVGHLTRDAVAYCCAYTGLCPPDTRAVEGPPDTWLRLPERDWWH